MESCGTCRCRPPAKWWESFQDSELDALVAQVEINNQNLKAAEARVREARSIGQKARATLFPTVNGGATFTRAGAAISNNGNNNGNSGNNGSTISGVRNNYNLSLDVGWELDLWGRIRRTIEAADATTQATVADLQGATLSAQAELAQDYLLLRVQDATIQLLKDTVDAYDKSAQLTRNQYAVGVAARADVVQAEAQLKSTQAHVIDAGIERAQLEHAIALLVGKAPSEVTIAPVAMHAVFPDIPVALPSTLLERRPDIAGAERRTAAANAQIGVAEAAYYPSLTLSATGGFQSSVLGNLLTLPSRYWSLGPALAQVIFDAGLRRAQTAQAVATYDENVALYRQTVLTAFQDVEDNLAALRILGDETSVQDEAVAAARESVAITTNQYKAGTAQLSRCRRRAGRGAQQRANRAEHPWPATHGERRADQGAWWRLGRVGIEYGEERLGIARTTVTASVS